MHFFPSQFLWASNSGIQFLWARIGLAGLCFRVSHKTAVKVWPVLGLTRTGSVTELMYMVVGRGQFLLCCWTEGLSSYLAIGQSPPSIL